MDLCQYILETYWTSHRDTYTHTHRHTHSDAHKHVYISMHVYVYVCERETQTEMMNKVYVPVC